MTAASMEKHYTVGEIAEMWHFSYDTIRRMFQDRPGVLKFGESGTRRRKRNYISLRIPQSVVDAVWTERSR